MTGSDAAGEILERVRDPSAAATSVADICILLTHAQRLVNTHTNAVLVDVGFRTEPQRAVYSISGISEFSGTPIDEILSVKYLGGELRYAPWKDVSRNKPNWLRAVGVPRFWTRCGRDVFVVSPSSSGPDGIEIQLRVRPMLAPVIPEGPLAIPAEFTPPLLDFVESLVWMRLRNPKMAVEAFNRIEIFKNG